MASVPWPRPRSPVSSPKFRRARKRNPALDGYLDWWLHAAVEGRLRAKTARDYRTLLLLYLRPALGEVRLDRLPPNHVPHHLEDERHPHLPLVRVEENPPRRKRPGFGAPRPARGERAAFGEVTSEQS